jgi:hypothetical protein
MSVKSNWKFFANDIWKNGYFPFFRLPSVRICDERTGELEKYENTWAYFDSENKQMVILKEHDCIAVRLHEYGHWINLCVYFLLEVAWEFIWWGCSVRELFRKEAK